MLALGGLTACVPRAGTSSASGGAGSAMDDGHTLTVSALPVYRLVTSPAMIDSPSRLLVIQIRLSTADDTVLQFSPRDLALTLPGGKPAHVFDRARAYELLRRTTLAEADFRYLSGSAPAPGGISEYVKPQLTAMVAEHLLDAGVFGPSAALRGYVVVDTGEAMMSLDGAAMEVVVHRVDDAVPVRYAYQFGSAPATEAQ